MTLWAAKQGADQIEVQATSGSIVVKVSEHIGHARVFWGELGRLLDQIESEAKAEKAEV